MYSFRRTHIKDLILEQPNLIAKDCNQYIVKNDSQIVGELSGGDNFSFIQIHGLQIRIDRKRKLLGKTIYTMLNHTTGEILGDFDFSVKGVTGILSLANGAIYSFTQNNYHRKLFKPSTWGIYKFELSNSIQKINYSGKFLKRNDFEGEIKSVGADTILPIMCGIFMIEEKLRIDQDNAG